MSIQAKTEDAKKFAGASKHKTRPKETVVFQNESGFTLHTRLGLIEAAEDSDNQAASEAIECFGLGALLLGRSGVIQTERGNRDRFLKD